MLIHFLVLHLPSPKKLVRLRSTLLRAPRNQHLNSEEPQLGDKASPKSPGQENEHIGCTGKEKGCQDIYLSKCNRQNEKILNLQMSPSIQPLPCGLALMGAAAETQLVGISRKLLHPYFNSTLQMPVLLTGEKGRSANSQEGFPLFPGHQPHNSL